MQQNKKICNKCKYNIADKFVPFELNDSNVLFVCSSPTAFDAKSQSLLSSKYGTIFRENLLDRYLGEKNYSIACVIACTTPINETVKAKEVHLCTDNYLFKITTDYKFIVTLGEEAFRVFFPKDEYNKKTKYSQYINNFIEKDGTVFFIMGDYTTFVKNEKITAKAKLNFLRWYNRYTDRYADREYTFCETQEEIAGYFDKIKDVCAIDTETIGVYDIRTTLKGGLKSVSISYEKNKAFGWLVDHPDNYDVQFKEYTKIKLQEILNSKTTTKVFHNAKFDVRVLADNDYTIYENSVVDTMLMANIYNETEKSFGLKELTAKYLDGYNDIAPLTDDAAKLVLYNCEDSDNTLQLYYFYKDKLPHYELLTNVVMPTTFFLTELESRGAVVDEKQINTLFETTEQAMARSIRQLEKLYPKTAKNVLWTSPDQVADFLYKKEKYPVLVKTDGGKSGKQKPSTSKQALARLAVEAECYAAKIILDYRKNSTLHNTFLNNSLLGKIQKSDGRIHTQFNQAVTATGRLSSSKPNLQNMPRRDDLRNVFTAPDGYVIVNGDLSQIELRIVASLANEKTMIKAYLDGVDLHTYTAANIILNVPIEDVTKDYRSKAKPVNFGYIYGQSAKGFLMYALMSYGIVFTLLEATQIRNNFFKRYSGLLNYYREIQRQVKFKRYVESPFGRRRHFPPYMYKMQTEYEVGAVFRKAVNAPTQGTASDIMMKIAVKVRKIIKKLNIDIYPFLTVHDSIMYYVKENLVKDANNIIQDVTNMVEYEISDWFKVPLVIEVEVGKKWGELKEIT